jgi:1-deoxy-D-xylulose-5-phosphate synthase
MLGVFGLKTTLPIVASARASFYAAILLIFPDNVGMTETTPYAVLGRIDAPAALRALPASELPRLAEEMRRCLVETLARNGGHFAASLGAVELAIALHRAFDTPHDRLVWDIGHQAHPHKMLTGRRAQLETQRRLGGLAPFLSRAESEYDAFGAGHAGTSLSAAAGMAAAARLKGEHRRVVAVIGDGGLTAGMAFEALNHLGATRENLLVIVNDNAMSISENVGALCERKGLAAFFGALGFAYEGPIGGHDLGMLIPTLERLRDHGGPRALHVITAKGRGYTPAERDPIAYHGVTRFDPVTGAFPTPAAAAAPAYSRVFGDWLCEAAARDPRVVAITPAMREGSGLVEFAKRFPDRYFDVGIAEQHAVTLAAGLACEGLRPVVAIYSTFLQRGYDQLIHDVAIQNLPVLFAIDRAGLVGADGATHHGAFDLAFLRCVPNLTVMAPADGDECRRMLSLALEYDGPCAVRYPRGNAHEATAAAATVTLGDSRLVREARARRRPRVALLAFGDLLHAALQIAEILDATVVDMRFVKPLDTRRIAGLADSHELLVTIEDGVAAGGASGAVAEALATAGRRVALLQLGLPDRFVEHGSRDELLARCGLDAAGLLRSVQKYLRLMESEAVSYSAAASGAARNNEQ